MTTKEDMIMNMVSFLENKNNNVPYGNYVAIINTKGWCYIKHDLFYGKKKYNKILKTFEKLDRNTCLYFVILDEKGVIM